MQASHKKSNNLNIVILTIDNIEYAVNIPLDPILFEHQSLNWCNINSWTVWKLNHFQLKMFKYSIYLVFEHFWSNPPEVFAYF